MLTRSLLRYQTQSNFSVVQISCVSCKWFHQSNCLSTDVSSDEYQYLHKSQLHTYKFQKSLMRLPIPDLTKTCDRYLASQRVILNDDEYARTQKIVQDFQNGIGKELQQSLKQVDKANKHTSYISEHWFDMYLRDRVPVVLNYNPFLTFYPEERPGYADPVIRATNILVSSLRFYRTLRECVLMPEVYHLNSAKSDTERYRSLMYWAPEKVASMVSMLFKAFPLDMSQFDNLFNSTRIPQIGKDSIKLDRDAKHMMVMKNGNFYVFDVIDKDGNIVAPSYVHACLSYIYKDSSPMPKNPLGVLTAINRDEWARAREELVKAGNEKQLNLIDTAAFNIIFDGESVGDDPKKIYRQFLYGDCANRWFDKSFSVIFSADGMTALNFEHAWGDGVAIMRYFNEVDKDCVANSKVHPDSMPASIDASSLVTKLEFNIPPAVESTIQSALKSTKDTTGSLNVAVLESDMFGKNLCKEYKVSPDAVMQLGFQVAYYEMTGGAVATYESCSTSAFKHGRTETIRPMTHQTKEFSEAVLRGEKSPGELKHLIKEASAKHGALTKEAAMGQGFDRHLFGLRKEAEKKNLHPELFADPAYAKINHNIISTSTLPSNRIIMGGFGAVVKDGLGVGYQIKDDNLGLIVSSYPPHADGQGFVDCAGRAYTKIKEILQKS